MRKLLIPFLIGLFVASGAMAQTKSALTGAVVDQDNAPLPGVTVSLASDELIGGTQIKTTEGNGEFKFLLLPPGNYHVEATLDGFLTADEAMAKRMFDWGYNFVAVGSDLGVLTGATTALYERFREHTAKLK